MHEAFSFGVAAVLGGSRALVASAQNRSVRSNLEPPHARRVQNGIPSAMRRRRVEPDITVGKLEYPYG